MAQAAAEATRFIDLDAFRAAPLGTDPFSHLVVPGFLSGQGLEDVARDFPAIDKPGSFPLSELTYGPVFEDLVAELRGDALRDAMAEKFDIDLAGRPTMITIRGCARPTDGKIHTDTKSKLITVLIYMNSKWEASGGRLRLLRSKDNLEDYVAEVPPIEGTLLAFKVAENSWHGHEPASGPRRSIQLNWVTDESVVRREQTRHRFSARLKRFFAPAY